MDDKSKTDSLLAILGNPIRRKIIRRLSQEPSYALELAKEIGIGQQLATNHLSIMEQYGIVGSSLEKSPVGPRRRRYYLKQSACLSVSFGPHLYNEQLATFETLPPRLSKEAAVLLRRVDDIDKCQEAGKICSLSALLADIDKKLTELEGEKGVLLHIRNLAMGRSGDIFEEQEKTHDERRVLHYLLDERRMDVEAISKALNLHESVIRGMLERLRKDLPALADPPDPASALSSFHGALK